VDGARRVAGRCLRDGNLIESTAYIYDAASNIVSKVQQIAFTPTPTASIPTATKPAALGA
jgi:hypothetical protein